MKVTKRLNDSISVTAEGDELQEVFSELAALEEIFSIDTCGKCNKKGVRHVVRVNDELGAKFYEVHCVSCFARASFGVKKGKGGYLFPHKENYKVIWQTIAEIKQKTEEKKDS